ncbi:hypothetical protein FJZ22_00170 [Candidatus Pacearchaeota archaeon]|nr:hypothetical protein [Candidatus Pacearchaeota archaeon]
MESSNYALLLERLCLASDAHDWVQFERLWPVTRQAYETYNHERRERGWVPVTIHEESWNKLWREAHRLVRN